MAFEKTRWLLRQPSLGFLSSELPQQKTDQQGDRNHDEEQQAPTAGRSPLILQAVLLLPSFPDLLVERTELCFNSLGNFRRPVRIRFISIVESRHRTSQSILA